MGYRVYPFFNEIVGLISVMCHNKKIVFEKYIPNYQRFNYLLASTTKTTAASIRFIKITNFLPVNC